MPASRQTANASISRSSSDANVVADVASDAADVSAGKKLKFGNNNRFSGLPIDDVILEEPLQNNVVSNLAVAPEHSSDANVDVQCKHVGKKFKF